MEIFNPCFLIPCYNHGSTLLAVIDALQADFYYPVLVVDDASSYPTQSIINTLKAPTMVHRLDNNQGKGGAVMAGLKKAQKLGFSHAIQIDADGQHDLNALPELILNAKKYSNNIISGAPIYDKSVPKGRLYGRYLTHVWVWVETLSFTIKDSMCGFRVYPVDAVNQVIANSNIGKRMDFDIEIMVKSFWEGIDIRFIDIKVIYPEDGISHFQPFADNLRITKMHTCLVFGMLRRLPKLVLRKRRKTEKLEHWSKQSESGTYYGMKLLLAIYSLFGRGVFKMCLKPILFYYSIFSKKLVRASSLYLQYLTEYMRKK